MLNESPLLTRTLLPGKLTLTRQPLHGLAMQLQMLRPAGHQHNPALTFLIGEDAKDNKSTRIIRLLGSERRIKARHDIVHGRVEFPVRSLVQLPPAALDNATATRRRGLLVLCSPRERSYLLLNPLNRMRREAFRPSWCAIALV